MPTWAVAILTTVIAGLISAGAALWGAKIGGDKTLQAARESFDRAERAERDTWRRALHHECAHNIRVWDEDPEGTWEFETRVLDEIALHSGALKPTDLERVLRIKVDNLKIGNTLAEWRVMCSEEPADALLVVEHAVERPLVKFELHKLRKPVIGEIIELEKSLRE